LAGAILGPVGDFCHVFTETTGYPQGVFAFYFWKIPFWVPLLFGGAALMIGLSHPFLDRLFKAPLSRPGSQDWKSIVCGLVVFIALYSLSGFLPWEAGGFSDIILAMGGLGVWGILDRTWQGILFGILTAIVGTFIEIILVKIGAFYYLPHASNVWGVASWLPWIYIAASVTVGNLGRKLPPRN